MKENLQLKTNDTADYMKERLKKAISLYKQKNVAYGDSFRKSLEKYGIVSAIIRLGDKLQRAESLLIDKNRNEIKDESVIDTLTDLAMYSMMLSYELEKGCLQREGFDEAKEYKTESLVSAC